MEVEASGVAVDIAGLRIVVDASLRAQPGSTLALVGPNGCGKTTLLRTVYRAIRPAVGEVRVGDARVGDLRTREAARRTAVVFQDDLPEFEFTVSEVVALGRVPHHGLFERDAAGDAAIVAESLATTGIEHLGARAVNTLSGGERQRVYLARALAQRTPVLVLDEPTNHLDVATQIALLELLVALPVTVVTALHDLNLAAAYCDQIVVMAGGEVVAHGPPADVLTPDLLAGVFGVRAHCTTNPLTGRPALLYAALPARAPATGSPQIDLGAPTGRIEEPDPVHPNGQEATRC